MRPSRTLLFILCCLAAAPATRPATVPVYRRPKPASLALPASPGDHKLKFTTQVGGKRVTLPYLLHLPAGYAGAGRRSPMLVFLHGAGECGTDLAGIYHLGPMRVFRKGAVNERPAMADTCPFVILCPQCPPRGQQWTDPDMTRATVELIDGVVRSGRVDADRVYATGLSMGGVGTWAIAEEAPDLFAAIAPMSALAWHPATAAAPLRSMPVWAVTGLRDEQRFIDAGHAMRRALAGTPARFTFVAGQDHGVYNWFYDSPQFYEWFLSHRRPPPIRTDPVVRIDPVVRTDNATIGDQPWPLDYALFIPRTPRPAKGYPAVLFLHEFDGIGPDPRGVALHGPDLALERDPTRTATFPFIVISPRLPIPYRWDSPGMTAALGALLDHVSADVGIDPSRVSVTGVDAGAVGAWRLADADPNRFAALVWVSTQGSFNSPADVGRVVRAMPGRAFVPERNPALARWLATGYAGSDRDWQTVTLPAGASVLGDLPAYSDPAVWDWLARQDRSTPRRPATTVP